MIIVRSDSLGYYRRRERELAKRKELEIKQNIEQMKQDQIKLHQQHQDMLDLKKQTRDQVIQRNKDLTIPRYK